MAEFTSDLMHIGGTENVVADMLSRLSPAAVAAMVAVPQTLDYAAVAAAQRDCPSIEAAKDTSLSLKLAPLGT